MAKPILTFEALASEYADLWDTMEIRAERMPAITATARAILKERARYAQIERLTNVPWFVVGIIHAMEAGLRFDRHLHNGDSLAARTWQVPKGRPLTGRAPFTWEESAADALLMKGFDKVPAWTVPRIAYELERYNGWGYRRFHAETLSPYLWSGTRHYTRGKYVADSRWSATAVSAQSGAMALLKRLAELEPSLDLETPQPDPADEFVRTPDAPPAPTTMLQSTEGNTAIAVGGLSTTLAANEAAAAVTKVSASGQPFSLAEFAVALASSPNFWIAVFTLGGSAYLWLRRRSRLHALGV
jgi:lysozyme family protein